MSADSDTPRYTLRDADQAFRDIILKYGPSSRAYIGLAKCLPRSGSLRPRIARGYAGGGVGDGGVDKRNVKRPAPEPTSEELKHGLAEVLHRFCLRVKAERAA